MTDNKFDNFTITIDSLAESLKRPGVLPHDFKMICNKPIILNGNYMIALKSFNLWYSWYNISSEIGNNTFRYNNGVDYVDVTIPDGQYTIYDLNSRIHTIMKANGDYTVVGTTDTFDINISADRATSKVYLELTNSYTLDLSNSTLNVLLGFNQEEIGVTGLAPNRAIVDASIKTLYVHCDLVTSGGGSLLNGDASDILYSFVPNAPAGYSMAYEPFNLTWFPIVPTNDTINSIHIYLTDNSNNIINLNDEPITCVIDFIRI